MTEHLSIEVEKAAPMTAEQERRLLASALAAAPGSLPIRRRLAVQLTVADAFGEVIELLSQIPVRDRSFDDYILIAQAHLARETADDNRLARAACDDALAAAVDAPRRAAALAARGKAEDRLGLVGAAEQTLRTALELNPFDKNACKRLAAMLMRANQPEAVIALVDGLAEHGPLHSRALAAETLALARLGRFDAARASVDHASHRLHRRLPTPAGWDSLDAFNAALREELLTHPGLRYDRYGTASSQTWRVDEPLAGRRPLIATLMSEIAKTIERHVAGLAQTGHRWLAARPTRGLLHSWCVITESTGFELWHVHQFGWMSGVYYVDVPDAVVDGTDEGGCLAFGIPEEEVGAAAAEAFGRELVRPGPGSMLLFPSHAHHRTYPHHSTERRICVAFDVWPA